MIDYNIISTGSKGNALVINKNILIDCGVPFKALKDVYEGLRIVLLTHKHGDHFNRSTIQNLAKNRPTLRFGCCEWLVKAVCECGVEKRNIDVYTPGYCFFYKDFCTIQADRTVHNAENCAYHIWMGDVAIFYATDTNSMDGIVAKNYNIYFVEANYSEDEIVERIKRKQDEGTYCYEWDVLNNHLSLEKANNWLYENMGPRSSYVLIHGHTEESTDGRGGVCCLT